MDLKNMKTMLAIYKDMKLTKYTIVLNDALSKDHISLYEVTSFLEKEINYILPANSYIKNMRNILMEGKIITLEKNYQKDKTTLTLTNLLDKILK